MVSLIGSKGFGSFNLPLNFVKFYSRPLSSPFKSPITSHYACFSEFRNYSLLAHFCTPCFVPPDYKTISLNTRRFSGSGRDLKTLSWEDHEDIADLLFEKFRHMNPLSLRFTELHEMVQEVVRSKLSSEVTGECSEGALERIQMTWFEMYEDD